jgi:acyl-CoA synthetase (AMP-forming)/AMP-acid ligase II/pimeloyl-ACP methyl ester carboxylesterase
VSRAAAATARPTPEQWRGWGVDPAWSHWVDVDSHDGERHRWHLLERRPDAPLGTVVCVHGNPTWSYLWHRLLQRLGDRWHVVALDQLGMGLSDRVDRQRYADRVRDLDDALRALGLDGPVVLVGHDWGGAVVQGWAVDHPGRVAGLVLCNTGIAVPAGRRAPWLIRLAAAGPVTDLVGRRSRAFVGGTIGLARPRLPVEVRDALRAPYRSADQRSAIRDFVDDVPFDPAHPSAAAIADVAGRIGGLTAPALLVWGARDPVFDDSFALDLAARLPGADQHRFADAGHLAPLEADVAGVVDAWLSERVLAAGGPGGPLGATAPPAVPPDEAATGDGTGYVPTWAALDDRADDPSVAFVDGATGARTSFHELHRRVTGIARGLAALGLQPGQRVAMLVPPSVDLVAAVYAVWRAGGVTVVADRGLGLRGLGAAVRGAQVDWVIGAPRAITAARALRWAPAARFVSTGPTRTRGTVAALDELARSSAVLPDPPAPDDPAAVLYTSGATGPAKGVRYRHVQLAAQRDALARTYGITPDDRLVAAFAPFALYGPALGIASTIPDVDVTRPGTLTAEALGAACATVDATIVFASPAALANVVRTSTGADPGLARVRLALSAGAPVPVGTLRAMRGLVPAAELHTPYGMTECLPVADIGLDEIDAAGAGRGVCVGRPVPGARVFVAPLGFDAATPVVAVPPGVTGEVLVRAPWVSDGYDRRWATQREARPVDAAGRRWHRSGDVGHVDAQGRLWIEGRAVHVVHTDRGPVTPVPVEVAAERVAGVHRSAAVGVGPVGCQALVVVVEVRTADDGLAPDDLARSVRAEVDRPVAAVLQVSDLPVDIRHNTKIDRTLVARWAEQVLSGARGRRPW